MPTKHLITLATILTLTTPHFAPASSTTPLSQSLQTINQQITQPPYRDHLLADYLRESSAIVSRLLGAIDEDLASGDPALAVDVDRHPPSLEFRRTSRRTWGRDAEALIESLREEMALIDHDARAAEATLANTINVRDLGAVGVDW